MKAEDVVCETTPSCPPRALTPTLTSFKIRHRRASSKLPLLLLGIGEPLELLFLDWDAMPATFFLDIERSCPNLKELYVLSSRNVGSIIFKSFFTHPTFRLKFLALDWDIISRGSLKTILSMDYCYPVMRLLNELRLVNVQDDPASGCLDGIITALKKNDVLKRISFQFDVGQYLTRDPDALETELSGGIVQMKRTVRGRLALLSVLRRHKLQEATKDVLELVFAFATLRRHVIFEWM